MSILVTSSSRLVVQGITGREASMVTGHTLNYGSTVVAGVTPGKGGQVVHGVPVYDTLAEACRLHNPNVAVVYVPPVFVLDAVMECIDNGLPLVFIAAENVPRWDALRFLQAARKAGIQVIGPNSVGIISPGDRVKVGAIGGDRPERCFVPGNIGVLSRSGGMTAELSWEIKKAGFGVSTAVSIGGDPLIGTRPAQLLELFEADPDTKAVVGFAEPGTTMEEDVAALLQEGRFTKPLFYLVAGSFTESLPEGTVFGHAAALISGGRGRPSDKRRRLRESGALVAGGLGELAGLLAVRFSTFEAR